MFSAKRNRERAMRGVVPPVIQARSMGADVLADVAARYGVGIASGARALRVQQGAQLAQYAVNADGNPVFVQAVLAVDGAVVGDAVPVGYDAARRKAASCQIRRRAVQAPVQSKAVARAESLAARNAALLLRVLDMVTQGHRRADIRAALGISESLLRAVTSGAGIVWPQAHVPSHAPSVKAQRAKAKVAADAQAKADAQAAQRAARLVRAQELSDAGASKTEAARALGLSWMGLQKLVAGTDITFADGNSGEAKQKRKAAQAAGRAVTVDALRALAAQGMTRTGAAQAAGISVDTLRARVAGTDIVFREGRGGRQGQTRTARADATARDARIVDLYRAGVLQRDIAQQVGLSFARVSAILRSAGVEGERQREMVARTAAVAEAVRSGQLPSAVAARFGITLSRVRAICCKAGVRCLEKQRSPDEVERLRAQGVARVRASGGSFGAITRVAGELGVTRQQLSGWVNAARAADADQQVAA